MERKQLNISIILVIININDINVSIENLKNEEPAPVEPWVGMNKGEILRLHITDENILTNIYDEHISTKYLQRKYFDNILQIKQYTF